MDLGGGKGVLGECDQHAVYRHDILKELTKKILYSIYSQNILHIHILYSIYSLNILHILKRNSFSSFFIQLFHVLICIMKEKLCIFSTLRCFTGLARCSVGQSAEPGAGLQTAEKASLCKSPSPAHRATPTPRPSQ